MEKVRLPLQNTQKYYLISSSRKILHLLVRPFVPPNWRHGNLPFRWIECCRHWLVLFYCVYGTERDGNKCISIYWINMFLVCFICPNWFATVLTQRTCYNKCISTVQTSLQTQRKCIHLLCLLIVLSHSKLKRSNQKIEILCFFDIFKTSTRWNEG